MNLVHPKRSRNLGSPACSDLMACEDIDVEGPGHRCALDQVRNEVVYPRIFFVRVTLCIFLTLPKAQGKDLVRLGIRYSGEHSAPPFGSCIVKERLCLTASSGQLPKNGARRMQLGFQVACDFPVSSVVHSRT